MRGGAFRRVGLVGCALAAAGLAACGGEGSGPPSARLSLVETLGGADTAGYARAMEPRPFVFPRDHGPHPRFRNEWWYVTGNLATEAGRAVGFQFTVFRSALAPEAPVSASSWATSQAYMAHFTLTDVAGRRFHAFQRFSRGALDLAGARADPFAVWLDDWSMVGGGKGATFPLRLTASEGDVAVDLRLEAGVGPVAQGDAGLSRKGFEPGNASYYYSFPRMPTTGTVVLGDDTLRVTGASWLDREWSTSALPPGVVGWDWFALQLDQGWELMAYALRNADGSSHALSDATLIDPDGARHPLAWGSEVRVEATGTWTSPEDGTEYPSGWRITLPGRTWTLDVAPRLPDQELDGAFRYWEGAVSVRGMAGGVPVSGKGYVELTGYAGRLPSR